MAEISVVKPSEQELDDLGVDSWGVWEKEESVFEWSYSDSETCYILDGEAIVSTSDGQEVKFQAGDLVTFPSGLDCRWEIIKRIKKRFAFNVRN